MVLASASLSAYGQSDESRWEGYMQAGMEAWQQGKYAEAEKQFLAAFQEEENLRPEDPRDPAERGRRDGRILRVPENLAGV